MLQMMNLKISVLFVSMFFKLVTRSKTVLCKYDDTTLRRHDIRTKTESENKCSNFNKTYFSKMQQETLRVASN